MTDPLLGIYETEPDTESTEDEEQQEIDSELTEEEEDAHTVQFTGFASPTPFLIEKPRAYVSRLAQAAQTLICTPGDDKTGGTAGRILYSPAISLPFILPVEGDRMYEHSRYYPLLNLPEGRPYDDPDLPVDAYALAVIIAYELPEVNYMGEPGDGLLLTWDDIARYAVPDKFWSRALDLAGDLYRPLRELNLARLVHFSQPEQAEREQLARLCQAWQIDDSPAEIISRGQEAAQKVEELWNKIAPDRAFTPYE